ncbi:MAG: hypothetical protein AAFN93_18015 [Bacteroidota bacterium]
MIKKSFIFILLALFTSQLVLAGGGWPQKKGKGFFKLGQNFIISDSFFDPNGDIIDITTISLYTTSIYGEFGLTDRLTAVAYVPFFVRSTINEVERRQSGNIEPGDELNSIGDADIGFKYALTQDKKYAVSVGLTFGLAFGENQGGESGILQTGDGEYNQLISIDVSRSFYPAPIYATVSTGFNNRTRDFSDEFRYGFEIGYTGFKNFTLALKAAGVASFQNGDASGVLGNSIFANNTEFFSITPEVNYDVSDKFGLSASIGFAPYGKRILASPNVGFGAFLKI